MIREAFFSTTPDLPVWLLRLVFSVTLVCLAAAVITVLLRRKSAALRHRVWALSVAASLAMPAMLLWSPEVRLGWMNVAAPRDLIAPESLKLADLSLASTGPKIEFDPRVFEAQESDSNVPLVPAPARSRDGLPRQMPATAPATIASNAASNSAPASSKPTVVTATVPQTPLLSRIDTNTFWFFVLIVPAAWGIWKSARAMRAARKIVSLAQVIEDPAANALAADVCRRLGWRRPLELRQSRLTPVPLCVGWQRPCVLLPMHWRSWGDLPLRAVLAHEVSHVVRGDVAWQFAARIACALYWFHPLVWMAARKMRVEREAACDDRVLGLVDQPVDYASVLLRFAREMVARSVPAEAIAMASLSGLEGRVRAILDKSRPRSPVGVFVGRLSAVAAILICAAAASLSPLSHELTTVAAADEGLRGKTLADAGRSAFAPEWARTEEAGSFDQSPVGGRLQSGEIVGNVVLKSDGKGLGRARILGIPENPKASYVTAVADEQGHFHVPRVRSAMLLLAQNGERTLSGLARIEPDEPSVVISVQSPVNVRGRLLNWKGERLGQWPLEYCLVVDGAFLDEYHMSQTADLKRLLGGFTMTADSGEFMLPGLAPGLTYRISCCPGTQVGGATQPFITITTFTSKPTGVTQLGDVKRPRTPTLEDVFLKVDSPAEQVAKVLESATESARMRDQRVLLLAGPQKNAIVRAIRATLAVSSPVNWSPTGSNEPSAPSWAANNVLQPPLSNYSVLGLEVAKGGATGEFLGQHKVALPEGDDMTLAALDLDGNVVGQISGRKLLSDKNPNVQPLISWLHANAPKMVDAEKLLAEALRQAKVENKRIFLREDAPQDGVYGARLNRYAAQFKDLLEKDYVCLKIDARCPNADVVITRIRDYDMYRDTSGGNFSLPWMVILDKTGKPLVSGTSPRGNIGIPDTAQETSYFAWMLRATAQRLTDEEITVLVSGMNKVKQLSR